ncbi:hypothetical protein DPW03_10910 [Aggregatibacter aphrophilus]|jgi:hypothetical protein|nr:hypothetical protein DPW03_10910 [Aggregatibacter aphrophilus]RDE96370.1 hypothetical protein DPW02_10345 [Aggregatibacter aphrophilus]
MLENKPKLTKEDNSDIDFAITCLFYQAITLNEFKEWLYNIIKDNNVDDLPMYIWDLVDFNNELEKIFDVIEFVPSSSLTIGEKNALYTIALKRSNKVIDMPISLINAKRAFELNPHILKHFKETFSFIKIED